MIPLFKVYLPYRFLTYMSTSLDFDVRLTVKLNVFSETVTLYSGFEAFFWGGWGVGIGTS